MLTIYDSNIIKINRGDSGEFELFINSSTDQCPRQYVIKDYVKIVGLTDIKNNSILKSGSLIKENSKLNNEVILNDMYLTEDTLISGETILRINSYIKVDSLIKSESILNDSEVLEDMLILEDEVYFGLMENNQVFENAIVKKKFNKLNLGIKNNIIIKIDPIDTVNLIPGKYWYQIKAKLINNYNKPEVNTVIQKTLFYIED